MSARSDAIAPPIYAVIDFVAIIGPALAFKLAADRGGLGDTDGMDLVIASALIGTVHAVIAGRRLLDEEHTAHRRADIWIAAIDALAVLALAATLLPAIVLWGFAEEHASIANRGYPVVALWVGTQLVAVVLAELTGRTVFWWLEPPEDWVADGGRRPDPDPARQASTGPSALSAAAGRECDEGNSTERGGGHASGQG